MIGFDKVIDEKFGFLSGSDKVLFIKTGQGGSIYGYKNRYLELAAKIKGKLGFSTFVSITENDGKDTYMHDMKVLEECIGGTNFEIYYLGVSKGGLIGLWHGAQDPRIKRMSALNAPLMINFYNKTLPAVKLLGKEKLTLIYGSLDPSYKYVPFISSYADVRIIDGADHNLKNAPFELFEIVYHNLTGAH